MKAITHGLEPRGILEAITEQNADISILYLSLPLPLPYHTLTLPISPPSQHDIEKSASNISNLLPAKKRSVSEYNGSDRLLLFRYGRAIHASCIRISVASESNILLLFPSRHHYKKKIGNSAANTSNLPQAEKSASGYSRSNRLLLFRYRRVFHLSAHIFY